MADFFRQNNMGDQPPPTVQRQFLAAINSRQSVVASFPLGAATASLYGFSVLFGSGMVVVVSPDSRVIQRNLAYFAEAGLTPPEVAFLDGTQMPHEERAIREAINHHRVRLLYTTPERFTSLTFLELFVRANVPFLVIEQADRLLSIRSSNERYRRFNEDGLGSIRHLPPLVLMTPPLTPERLQELVTRYGLTGYEQLEQLPDWQAVHLKVAPLWSEHQKFTKLTDTLTGRAVARKRQPGRKIPGSGPVLIQAGSAAQTEKLGASLIDYGFQSVWMLHNRQSPSQQQLVLEAARTRPDTILVNGGFDTQEWQPPLGLSPQIIYWQPPPNLDSLIMTLFRQIDPVLVGMPVLGSRPDSTHPAAESRVLEPQSLEFFGQGVIDDSVSDLREDDPNPLAGELPESQSAEELAVLFGKPSATCSSVNPERAATPLKALILYTREDYFQAVQRIRGNKALDSVDVHDQLAALKRYRGWILEPGCRLRSLYRALRGPVMEPLPPCGHCDRCKASRRGGLPLALYEKISRLFL